MNVGRELRSYRGLLSLARAGGKVRAGLVWLRRRVLSQIWIPPLIVFLVWFGENCLNSDSPTPLDSIHSALNSFKISNSFQLWWLLLITWIVKELIQGLSRAGRRTAVEEFSDLTGGDLPYVKGLNALLITHLGDLSDLFKAVEEKRPIRTAVLGADTIYAVMNVENITSFLKDELKAQEIAVKGIKIPVKFIVNLMDKLSGAQHLETKLLKLGPTESAAQVESQSKKETSAIGGRFVLVAILSGGKRAFEWRVERPLASIRVGGEDRHVIEDMVEELACRIFTDVALDARYHWRATRAFCEGLRHYRQSLVSDKEDQLQLNEAERRFLEAVSEDESFPLAYYNLGVVYTELKQTEAAQGAFRRAIERQPLMWEPRYGLATSFLESGLYEETIRMCEQINGLSSERLVVGRSHCLKSQALLELHHRLDRATGDGTETMKILKEAMEDAQTSISETLYDLLEREISGHRVLDLRTNAVKSLIVLSNTFSEMCKEKRCCWEPLLTQAKEALTTAIQINRNDPEIHYELGKLTELLLHYGKERGKEPADQPLPHYLEAIDLDRQQLRYLKAAIDVYWTKPEEEVPKRLLADFYMNVLTDFSTAGLRAMIQLSANLLLSSYASTELPLERRDLLQSFSSFVPEQIRDALTPLLENDSTDRQSQSRCEPDLPSPWTELLTAFNCMEKGKRKIFQSPREAIKCFYRAEEMLLSNLPDMIWQLGLYVWAAVALLRHGVSKDAMELLEDAEKSLPLNPDVQKALGWLYFTLADYNSALSAWRHVELLEPNDSEARCLIGIALLRTADAKMAKEERMDRLREAVDYLEGSLDLTLSSGEDQAGMAHYWLGIAHEKSRSFAEAAKHFRTAKLRGFSPHVSSFRLAYSLMEFGNYREADYEFAEVIEKISKQSLNEEIGHEMYARFPIWHMKVAALLGRVRCRLGKDVHHHKGLNFLEEASKLIMEQPEKERSNLTPHARVLWEQSTAQSELFRGIIYYQNDDQMRQAIEHLSKSVEKAPSAEAYLYLAKAYSRCLEMEQVTGKDQCPKLEGEEKDRTKGRLSRIRCMETYLHHAEKLDRNQGRFLEELKDLDAALKKYKDFLVDSDFSNKKS